MEYILGAAAGFVFGGVICALKQLLLWGKLIKNRDKAISVKQYSSRNFISLIIDIGILVAVVITKDKIGLYFPAELVGALLGIAMARRIAPVTEIMKHVKKKV